jgi:hypothetical protein
MTRLAPAFVLWVIVGCADAAAAQNLLEVQVFPDETLARGETELELHNVVMPSGTRPLRGLPDAKVFEPKD